MRCGDVRGSERVEERERDGGRSEVRAAVEREGQAHLVTVRARVS